MVIIMLLVGFGFVLKLTMHGMTGTAIWCIAVSIFLFATGESATAWSKSRIADMLAQPELMLDMAVLLTTDVAFQICFCLLAVKSACGSLNKYERTAFMLCKWFPGLLIFPTLFAAHTELVFALTGVDFSVIVRSVVVGFIVIVPMLSRLLGRAVPETDIRLEMIFMVNMIIAALGVVVTVNGRTAVAGTNDVEWRSLVVIAVSALLGAVVGTAYYKYVTHKKISKTE